MISIARILFALSLAHAASTFDLTSTSNLVAYWGQDSYGATNPDDTSLYQMALSDYCALDTVDVFPLAFLDVFFGAGDLPEINFANSCSDDDGVFSGSDLADCSFMASEIQACQAAGTIVTLSMGGASGSIGFTSDDQATDFATLIWDLFLGGSSDTRPFGSAVLDGIDLDIEGGSTTGYAAFVTQLRALADGADKTYYISAAPQCPYPDAYIGSTIDAVGFDMIYIQFYNNYCELTEYDNSADWDFSDWADWAENTSPNKDVKLFIGAPAGPDAGVGYVDAATLADIALETREEYSSFGGVMLWDISQAYANGRFDSAIKSSLVEGTIETEAINVAMANAIDKSSAPRYEANATVIHSRAHSNSDSPKKSRMRLRSPYMRSSEKKRAN